MDERAQAGKTASTANWSRLTPSEQVMLGPEIVRARSLRGFHFGSRIKKRSTCARRLKAVRIERQYVRSRARLRAVPLHAWQEAAQLRTLCFS
jgi:hypothetical protein